ncbi:gustatory receptor for sugar taste 64f-like [Melitaea cinxia]|uniref:gustatory receptor for sugar taste 64f-like n=1 Tax=Melitaea cinxia TaxID=113334 RepID=UPI001E26FC0A|nr:gustatory receptor for sugar taste 64f-like [Melitaea cinxia]
MAPKDLQPEPKDESKIDAQLEFFQSSMKYCIISGQYLGIFPFVNMTGRDVQNDVLASQWRALREDYNRATLLVHFFDDAINSIIFVFTAVDLFYVCSQLYFLIGFLIGYEYLTYLIISVTFYVIRFFTALLVAAKIHTASIEPVSSLYNVSTSSYCSEVQRFIEKINSDTVALSGLNFFYITRETVLSLIGTIVTYELVLLQFNRN